jgi:hypothetical protein
MPTPFAFYDPDSSSWRTSALSLVEEWGEFSETWPRSGMTRGGSAYELPTPELPTDVSGSSSSLPTPRASRGASGTETMYALGAERSNERRPQGEVVLLPTPEAKLSDSGPDYARASTPGSGGDDLVTTLAKMLPTPTSRDGKGPNQRGDATCLHGALLPTPKATDGTKGGPNQRGSSGDLTLSSAVQPLRMLPTPMAGDAKSARNSTAQRHKIPPTGVHAGDTLTDILVPPTWSGDRTPARSADGSTPSDGELHVQLSLALKEASDSARVSSSG